MSVFPREPSDGWHVGDLAYCVNDRTAGPTRPQIERGRVYRVAAVRKPPQMGSHGLKLDGIDTGKAWGFWSNKFVKLGPVGGRLPKLAAATEYTMVHYWERPDFNATATIGKPGNATAVSDPARDQHGQ